MVKKFINNLLEKSIFYEIIKQTFYSSIIFLLEFILGILLIGVWLWIKEKSIFFAFLTFFTPIAFFNIFETMLIPIFFMISLIQDKFKFLLEKSRSLFLSSIVIFLVLYPGLYIFKEFFTLINNSHYININNIVGLISGSFKIFGYYIYIVMILAVTTIVNTIKNND
ncbi:hypothetical protein [Cetobacterium ceti]